MLTTSENTNSETIIKKNDRFKNYLEKQPFILLARPCDSVYESRTSRNKFEKNLEIIISRGLLNLEIPWKDDDIWKDIMINLKNKYKHIQLGSASLVNKKSIDDSIKVGLNFSMMRFWQKDLFIYAKDNNHLLIPGIKKLKELKETIASNCKIIKMFPISEKEKSINLEEYQQNISFVAAGGISINDITKYKESGYSGMVIGAKGFNGTSFNPNIFQLLKVHID